MTNFVPATLCLVWVTITSSTSSFRNPDRCFERSVNINMTLSAQFCPNSEINKEQSLLLLQLYPGLFVSQKQLPSEDRIEKRHRRWSGNRNYDVCCPTRKRMEKRWELTNVSRERKWVVHLPSLDMYQFIQWGKCIKRTCPEGKCMMDTTIHYVLVWDWSSHNGGFPVSFDAFEIPTFCSCKHVWT